MQCSGLKIKVYATYLNSPIFPQAIWNTYKSLPNHNFQNSVYFKIQNILSVKFQFFLSRQHNPSEYSSDIRYSVTEPIIFLLF